MSDQIINFSKEVSEFIEANAAKNDDTYWFPQYFKKVGDCLFETGTFSESKGSLWIIEQRQLQTKEEKKDES